MALQFDNKISAGHLMTFAAMVFASIAAYADLRTRQSQLVAEVVAVKADAQSRESRIRAVEIAQASQSSDLRSIQIGISRIEAQLENLKPRP
ncbi:hypothetical protein [Gemmobacter sp.]|uniref:hypothetical protein n=1 Tax=Gemmobacter sp. TaxID=1898957 RepID=UPI002AFEF872|nr:hypothetical protein [Gemmobacter sp.]